VRTRVAEALSVLGPSAGEATQKIINDIGVCGWAPHVCVVSVWEGGGLHNARTDAAKQSLTRHPSPTRRPRCWVLVPRTGVAGVRLG
jgi:hypothetical protein